MAAPATAQLCFGSVRHKRLQPCVHAFGYGVFYLRLPLRTLAARGTPRLRLFSFERANLLSFHARDHGDRSGALLPWLDALLAREGVTDAGGEIWLQTFPRVFGYVFNPVSFYFCHRADGALRAVVCEVHNTFGERHCYLLEDSRGIKPGQELTARKVFHVSPFFDVAGAYRFRFLQAERDGAPVHLARIDYDADGGPALQTSVSGRALPLSDASALRALLRYPLMTIGVVLRIHVQALRLWCKRLRFHSKPVLPTHEVTR
ncbi:MAG TPA: DUF1365 domain-containing protein [Burkholderiaceae bacterium]